MTWGDLLHALLVAYASYFVAVFIGAAVLLAYLLRRLDREDAERAVQDAADSDLLRRLDREDAERAVQDAADSELTPHT
jgi:hypothetical protein